MEQAAVVMKRWQCHKVVSAEKIVAIERNPPFGGKLHIESGCVAVSPDYLVKHDPQVGGYFVVYEEGYQSFSPADVFEAGYTRMFDGEPCFLSFGQAIERLKLGMRVARQGWNGKGMWLALSPGAIGLEASKFWAGPNRDYAEANGGTADVLPTITMKTATGQILMGWLASQSDMLAEDWVVVR